MNSTTSHPEYTYRVFSEKIKIDIKVPFLNQYTPDKKSLNIKDANKIRNCKNKNYYSLNSNEAKFCRKDQLKVFIKNNLFYEVLNKDISHSDLSFKLLTHPMGLYLFKRKNYVLHSSAININNKAFLFMGLSGSGKSSVIASLLNYGDMITEDVSKIQFIDDSAFVYPSLPVIKLSKDILEYYKFETIDEFDIAGDLRNRKGYVVNNFDSTNLPVKICACFILNGEKTKEIQKVDADFAFRNLLMNSFSAIPKNECKESEKMLLDNISSFIGNVPIYNLPRQKKFSNKLILDFISKC